MSEKRLHYIGLFRSPVSWAKVNREFVGALSNRDWTVSATSQKGLHYSASHPVSPDLERIVDRERGGSVEMAMEYPDNLWKLDGTCNVAWVLYETDPPDHWVASYREHADLYACPSPFVRRKAVEAGLAEERCAVVPLGVDTDVFHPGVPPASDRSRSFTFLTIGPPHKRKGFRELIRAYVQRFSGDEPVRLLIKTYPLASSDGLLSWEFDLDGFLDEHAGAGAPEIEVRRDALNERAMAQLMSGADVFVLPSYGEAFGLSLLESMAVGTPVASTDYGPPKRIIDSSCGWLIGGERRQLTGVAYDSDEKHTFFVPDVDRIGTLLRNLYEQPEQIQKRRADAVRTAREWNWERSAKRFDAWITGR